jgi:signal transduction histidine kinase
VVLPKAKEAAQKQQRKLREYFEAKTHIKINVKPVAFADLVKELNDHLSTRKTHEIEVKYEDTFPEQLSTDMGKLIDVILELVTNAEKYSPEGSKITIAFKHEKDEIMGVGALKISVSDQGIGIEKNNISRIFNERNLRLNPEIANGNSSGNGLHVCGRIAKKLGGEITIDSEMGKGSTFTITLMTI